MARNMAGRARRLIAAALALPLIGATAASSPVAAFPGRYSWHFVNALVSGEKYVSDDVVEIVRVDADHAYVRFALNFYNGHTCGLAGVANVEGGKLIYREPADRSDVDRCTLVIQRTGANLTWHDGGSCKSYCGARGSFLDGNLAWSSRRPIRYLERLKTSRAYRDALTEWRTGKAVNP